MDDADQGNHNDIADNNSTCKNTLNKFTLETIFSLGFLMDDYNPGSQLLAIRQSRDTSVVEADTWNIHQTKSWVEAAILEHQTKSFDRGSNQLPTVLCSIPH